MGDARKDALRVEFDSRIKLEFHGATVTSDAGLEAAFSCNDSPLQARCRTQIRLWGFQFDGGLLWCSNGPAAESGEGHMGRLPQRLEL